MSSRFARNHRHPSLAKGEGGFLPSRQQDLDEDSPRSVIIAADPTLYTPPPVESIVVGDSSCCSSLETPKSVAPAKQFPTTRATNKKNRYRDLSRAALPTERGRRKVLSNNRRRRKQAGSREPKDSTVVREHQKAVEQRLVLDQIDSLLSWMYTQEKLAALRKEDLVNEDLDDSYSVGGESCNAVVFWCDSADKMENPVLVEEESFSTDSSSNEEGKMENHFSLPREQGAEDFCLEEAAKFREVRRKDEQNLLHKETLKLLTWLAHQERMIEKCCFNKEQAFEKTRLAEESQRMEQELQLQDVPNATEEETAEEQLMAPQDDIRARVSREESWHADCVVPLEDTKENKKLTEENERANSPTVNEFAIAYHGTAPETPCHQGTLSLPQNNDGKEKVKATNTTPATVNTSRSSGLSSSSFLLSPFGKEASGEENDLVVTPATSSESYGSEMYRETPTSAGTGTVVAKPKSLCTVANDGRDIKPKVVIANGTRCRGGNVLTRNVNKFRSHKKSKRTDDPANGRSEVPSVSYMMIPVVDRKLGVEEDDGGTALSSVSGLRGTRHVDRRLFRSPCSSAFPVKDEGYLHAQKAGMLWQTLVGEQVRFPKMWWNGARAPQMGVDAVLPDGKVPQKHNWKYIALDHCDSNPLLKLFVPNSRSDGILLLHIVVRDDKGRPVQDVAIGAYYPLHSTSGEETDYRTVWMAIRRRSDHMAKSTSLIDPVLMGDEQNSENLVQGSPIVGSRKVKNTDLRQVFGDKPPRETIFVLESELVKKIKDEIDMNSDQSLPVSLLMLEAFLWY